MGGGKVEIPNMATLFGWGVFGLQSGEIFSPLLKPESIFRRPTAIPAVTSNWTAWMRALPCQIHRCRLWVQLSQQTKTERKLTMKLFWGKKKFKQNDAGSKVRSMLGGYYFSELLGPYKPMCEILHPLSTSLLEQMTWVQLNKPMWLPLLHFIKNPSYKGKWAQQAGKVSYQGLEEWLEGNRREFTQTSWHMGVFGYIILKDRWILQGLGAVQTIPRPPCLQSPHKNFAWELLFLLLCFSLWITPL